MKIPSSNAMMGWLVGATVAVVLVSVILLLIGFGKRVQVTIGHQTVLADVADSSPARYNGLSGTTGLKDGQAMLFVFDYPSTWPIWMKDMNYPIDVIWLDKDKTVVDVASDLSPSSYPNSFASKQPALYVLEVNSGFIKRHDIKVGSAANFKLSH
jgi:uncharacterized membrane protein (UPF0127 family)